MTAGRRDLTLTGLDQIGQAGERDPAPPHEVAADPYYEPYFCDMIITMADDMQFPEEWAAEFGVSEYTMFSWIAKFPEFARAYGIAVTKLRAAFTREIRTAMLRPGMMHTASLFSVVAKKRFADLYGDPPPPGTEAPGGMSQPMPGSAGHGDGTLIEGSTALNINEAKADELRRELEALRGRQG